MSGGESFWERLTVEQTVRALLVCALLVAVARLWIAPLPSSFWTDETVTAFVVKHGLSHPSLKDAPQLQLSPYYWLPRAAVWLFGRSEVSYRLPSVLAMGLALFFIFRLAARLIHPRAGWFAVFACLGLTSFNFFAVDARPYALGICVGSGAILLLVRWLDSGRLRDGVWFALAASLMWWIHQIYWPFYVAVAVYTLWRKVRGETPVELRQLAAVCGLMAALMAPVLVQVLALLHHARDHVFEPVPSWPALATWFQRKLLAVWLLSCLFRWPRNRLMGRGSTEVLVLAWWCCQPLCLFAYSRMTGNSLFSDRYLSLSLPGAALAATCAAGWVMRRPAYWRPAALALALALLLLRTPWHNPWTEHFISHWREAALDVNRLALEPGTPVICPSSVIEGHPPIWRPDYPLPGFLYAHLEFYPIDGKPYLFSRGYFPETAAYATALLTPTLSSSRRFLIYGLNVQALLWRDWLAARPEMRGWSSRTDRFGDIDVVVFEPAAR